jgi:hypothetical protein
MIASIIWRGIDALDISVAELNQDSDDHVTVNSNTVNNVPDSEASKQPQRITVGSSLPITTLAELEREHGDDEAWTGLRKKTGKAFTGYFSRRITFSSHDEVRSQFIRTQFKLY